jgi:hypothetical protein
MIIDVCVVLFSVVRVPLLFSSLIVDESTPAAQLSHHDTRRRLRRLETQRCREAQPMAKENKQKQKEEGTIE